MFYTLRILLKVQPTINFIWIKLGIVLMIHDLVVYAEVYVLCTTNYPNNLQIQQPNNQEIKELGSTNQNIHSLLLRFFF